MDLSIVAITGNRQFSKALVRNSPSVDRIRDVAANVPTDDEALDVLQVVFMDRSADYIHPVPDKRHRVCQVDVGIGDECPLGANQTTEFLRFVLCRVIAAVSRSPLSEAKRNAVLERLQHLTLAW